MSIEAQLLRRCEQERDEYRGQVIQAKRILSVMAREPAQMNPPPNEHGYISAQVVDAWCDELRRCLGRPTTEELVARGMEIVHRLIERYAPQSPPPDPEKERP